MPPSKFTPEIVENLIRYIKDGTTIIGACRSLGLSYWTLKDWRKKETPEHIAFQERFAVALEEGLAVRKHFLEQIVYYTALGQDAANKTLGYELDEDGEPDIDRPVLLLKGTNWMAACRMLEAIDAQTWIRNMPVKNEDQNKVSHTIVMKRKEKPEEETPNA